MHEEIDLAPLDGTARDGVARAAGADLGRLHDVPVELAVEIGRTPMTIGETLALGPGSIVVARTAWPASRSTCWSTASRSPAARSSSIDEEFGLRVTDVSLDRSDAGQGRLSSEHGRRRRSWEDPVPDFPPNATFPGPASVRPLRRS